MFKSRLFSTLNSGFRSCVAFVCLPFIVRAAQAQSAVPPVPIQTLSLWDGPAPGTPANVAPETRDKEGRTRNVSVPTLSIYLPPKALATGTAVIVCSGGGYEQLAVEKHALGSVAAFLPQGIAVLSLKYRLKPPSLDARQNAIADAARAVRLARAHAAEWNLNPHRIGMVGHSAGANMILNLLTHCDGGHPTAPDPIERQSSRPDFVGLMSLWADKQKPEDFTFSTDTPPVFMCSALDDKSAPTSFTRAIAARLKAVGVPVQNEIYAEGGHQAFTLGQGAHGDWTPLFVAWLKNTQQQRTIVVFGDSITEGNMLHDAEKPSLWVTQVQTQSAGQLQMINRGKGGRPTNSVAEFRQMLEQQARIDLLVIALGGNDARDISGNGVSKAVKNVTTLIETARARFGNDLPILLVAPTNIRKDALGPTRPIANQREANLRELETAYTALAAAQRCDFVSLYGVIPNESLTRDGVHPDAAGNNAITHVMLPAIQRALFKK